MAQRMLLFRDHDKTMANIAPSPIPPPVTSLVESKGTPAACRPIKPTSKNAKVKNAFIVVFRYLYKKIHLSS